MQWVFRTLAESNRKRRTADRVDTAKAWETGETLCAAEFGVAPLSGSLSISGDQSRKFRARTLSRGSLDREEVGGGVGADHCSIVACTDSVPGG